MSGIHLGIIQEEEVRRQDTNAMTGIEMVIIEVGCGLMGINLYCPFLHILEILCKILF